MKKISLTLLTISLGALSVPTTEAATIVSENFGGLSTDPLNGTPADTFDAAITTAGGSSTWVAVTGAVQFNADGSNSISGNTDGTAYLRLGEYINNAKGTASGIFDLQATLTKPTGANWYSLGFFTTTTQGVNQNFTSGGIATALYRATSNEVDYFGGPGSTNTPSSGTTATGPQTIRIRLDLSGYNGTNNFGTVSFFLGSSTTAEFSHSYTVANDFESIGFTQDNGTQSTVSALTLTQIPEPSTFAMLLGGLGLMFVRRRG